MILYVNMNCGKGREYVVYYLLLMEQDVLNLLYTGSYLDRTRHDVLFVGQHEYIGDENKQSLRFITLIEPIF